MSQTPETPSTAPAKKAAAKKAAPAKATESSPAAKTPKMNPYLPSLPTGWSYDRVEVTGPDGALMVVAVSGDKASLTIKAGEIDTQVPHEDIHAASAALGDAAKTITKIAERQAELDAMRTDGLATLGTIGAPKAKAKAETPAK